MNRALILVTAAAALALSACTSTPAPQNDAAPPTTSNPTPPVAVMTEVVTQTVTNTPAAPEKPVIGSFGYGKLKLGMTLQQALDTRLIGPDKDNFPDAQCSSHEVLGTGQYVWVSKAKGVASISFTPAMASDGVGIGATEATLKAEYTNLVQAGPNYSYTADADDNAAAKFTFGVRDGKLWAAFLSLEDQDCHN
jgi:hypothetical protein